jgi:serine/threonine protein kinase
VRVDPEHWSALSRLLDEALDLPNNLREDWLNSLSASDTAHRATLRELLKHAASETRDFLLTLPKVADCASIGAGGHSTLAPGTIVGPYVVEEEIGRGGMGVVWRARRRDGAIKRPLALKLPHAGSQSRQIIDRFTRERDILGELLHPNIARLDDAGVTDSGQPFLALEYVPGLPLTQYCDQHRLDVRSRLQLCLQVLSAVQYAHSHLVIHRDLKPSNVLVTASGQAMLLDFGIAKLIPDDALDYSGRTQMAGVALTPGYASPEQIAGKPVSTASDIYSLGVLLFEVLTGERPRRLEWGTRGASKDAISAAEPQLPSAVVQSSTVAAARATTVPKLRRTLRGDLDTIVLKASKKSPAERYPTVDSLSADIERYLRGEPVSTRADSSWYRLRKFVCRHTLPVAAVSGAALLLIAAAVALAEAHINVDRDPALALSGAGQLVHRNPVIADSRDFLREAPEVYRLHEVAVDAEVVAAHQVAFLLAGGQHDHGNRAGAAIGLDTLQYLDAIDPRHLDVQQHHPGPRPRLRLVLTLGEQEFQRLLAVLEPLNVVGKIGALERAQGDLRIVRVVFDEQDLHRLVASCAHTQTSIGSVNPNVAPLPRSPRAVTAPS